MIGAIPVLCLLFGVLTTIVSQIQGQSCGKLQESQLNNLKEYTEPDEFPWIGRVGYGDSSNGSTNFYCLAVLIKPRHAILPAHCVLNRAEVDALFILFGDWRANRNFDEEDCLFDVCAPVPEAIDIEELVVHPKYMGLRNPNAIDNDIAVAKLVRSVDFSDFVAPLCLPTTKHKDNHIAQKLKMVGFLRRKNNLPSFEQEEGFRTKVDVHIASLEFCASLQDQLNLTQDHLCAMTRAAFLNLGSPLMGIEVEDGKPRNFYLVGLPSYGGIIGSERNKALFVFTRIFPFRNWILKNIVDKNETRKIK
ncbi:CLIP domain-containing serine protease 2-like [Drosophila rhopaloa]|uniref:Peptidase S1 domain-containing protein n=2 Tax=Drosophila rhopaloa TaxID=1041015 RepID=A0ABM5GY37_DRORH|nr:CLIP domain-containing serine protease 2-like [Drosophila rhopaloa]